MKNVLKAVIVTGAMVGMSGGVAVAATSSCTGTVSNIGPGSTNIITCNQTNTTTVSCDNNFVVDNSNSQSANSGKAFTTGNTSGGSSNTGGASNNNSFEVTIGASCELVPETPATPSTPVVSGGGAGAATPQVLAEQVSVKPVGGAGAGAGAGVATDKTAATVGILGSTGLIAVGVAIRKGVFNLKG